MIRSWFSFGDWNTETGGTFGFAAANPRTNLRTFIPAVTSQTYPSTACYNGTVIKAQDNGKIGVPQSGVLVGVSPLDPPTLGAVALSLGLVTMAACYLPARRVLRIDPAQSLRQE